MPRLAVLALGVLAAAPAPAMSAWARARYVASRDAATLAAPSWASSGFRQRARLLPDGRTEITVVAALEGPAPAPDAAESDLAAWMQPPEPADDWRRRAHLLAGEDPDAAAIARRIIDWVAREVAHAAPWPDESAATAFDARQGSCVGRSLLAVALLRGAGLPARTVHGVLLPAAPEGVNLGSAEFTLHRWVETWLPGAGWVPSDPGRSIHHVDPLHVVLAAEGSDYDPESQRGLVLRVLEAPRAVAEPDPRLLALPAAGSSGRNGGSTWGG